LLSEITIQNFVLIEDLRLAFGPGLNVLTGETGAGKSIVLDALGLLLGDRFASSSVRQGAERSAVEGIFAAPRGREFAAWRQEHGFEKSDELLIRREGYPDGRSRAFVNDRSVTLATLLELGEFLVDVHGQREHQQILKAAVQMTALDRFAGSQEACAAIAPLFSEWTRLEGELQKEQLSEEERLQRLDLCRFQLQEIEEAKLRPGEGDELRERLPELKNAERLRALAEAAYGALYEEEGSALEKLGQAERSFQALQALAPAVGPLTKDLEAARSRIEEIAHGLQALAERWAADPAALEDALARQEVLSRLEKKYGGTLEAVLEKGRQLRETLDRLENRDFYRQELEKRAAGARRALEKAARELSAKRRQAAEELGAQVQKQLADLGLKQAVFRCVVEASSHDFTSTGMDRVSFEWAPNPGEGMEPLKEIASGGELSRVMLALKTVLAQTDAVPTLVFDEIDAGIGGVTAHAVGQKLRALSRHHQILSVSHLPQIAACAHAHFQVTKRVAQGRTIATVTPLEPTERLHELARLLGSQVTPTSVQHAKELLAQNQ